MNKKALLILTIAAFGLLPVAAKAQFVSQMATSVASGLGKEVGGQLAGWGMAQLGFPGTNGTAEIVSLLAEIQQELMNIALDISENTCIDASTEADDAAARIQSAWTTYQNAVTNSYISPVQLANWVTYVEGVGDNSLSSDMDVITNDFTGMPSGVSILSTCEAAHGVTVPTKATLGDTGDPEGWGFSTRMINWYATIETLGVIMIVDDYHRLAYQAWLNEGNTMSDVSTDDIPVVVCPDPSSGSTDRIGACNSAVNDYTYYRTQNVVPLLQFGGAPYSTDKQVLLNGKGLLWVYDLNDFMTAGGYSSTCVNATSATTPCGAGVGEASLSKFYKYKSTSDEISYGDYVDGAWSVADADAWSALLTKWNSSHMGTFLQGLGTGIKKSGLRNRFFYTGEIHTEDIERDLKLDGDSAHFHMYEMACFVSPESPHSGPSQPVCSGDDFFALETYEKTHTNSNNPCVTFSVNNMAIDDSDPNTKPHDLIRNFSGGVYQVADCKNGHKKGWEDPVDWQNPVREKPPGWLLEWREDWDNHYDTDKVKSDANNQYRYPYIDLQAYYTAHNDVEPDGITPCTPEYTNGAGTLPSLCGSLLDAYIDLTIAPIPMAGAAPTVQVPDSTVTIVSTLSEVLDGTHTIAAHVVDYDHLVSASDIEDGWIVPDCFPKSGTGFGLGKTRVVCSALDSDGNKTSKRFEIHVVYPFDFTGKLARKELDLKAGRSLDIEFSMDGYKGLDVLTATPESTLVDCDTGEVLGEPEAIDSGDLTYKAGKDVYSLRWKTDRAWGNQCREIALPLIDDTRHTAELFFY